MKVCEVISSIYQAPQFKVVDQNSASTKKQQSAGIRQGCPLSPYLLVILLTVIFEDIHHKCTKLKEKGLDFTKFTELLLADDTLLIMKKTQHMNKFIKEIERESDYYNLRLNRDKCITIEMGGNFDIKFQAGQQLNKENNAKYLGSIMSTNAHRNIEINQRIRDTHYIFDKLHIFLKKTSTPIKWKIRVFNAVVISKLTYGMEALTLLESDEAKINTICYKGLRKI